MVYLIYFLLIFSSVFQDFFMVNLIGELGRSLTAIIVVPIFILYFIIGKKKIIINKYIKLLFKLGIYLIIINILNIFKYLIIDNGNIIILYENVVLQMIKGCIYFINIIVFMILIYNLQRNLSINRVFKPFVFTYLFLFIILILELKDLPNALSFLHNSMPYYRIRLTTSESSWTSSVIIVFFSTSYYYYKYIKNNKLMKNFIIFIFLTFIATSTSKGLILNMVISTLIITIIERKLKIKAIGIIMSILALVLLLPSINKFIINDLENYTSIVTRGYTMISGVLIMISNPLGIGNALYLTELPKTLDKYIYLFDRIKMNFNLSEIYSYINATNSQNISIKSGLIQYGMYWGFIGTILISIFFMQIYKDFFGEKNNKYIMLKFAYINLILLILTVMTFDIKYEIWSYFSLIIYMTMYNNLNENIGEDK